MDVLQRAVFCSVLLCGAVRCVQPRAAQCSPVLCCVLLGLPSQAFALTRILPDVP